MELSHDDLIFLMSTTDNIYNKMKHERMTNCHDINRTRLQFGEYHTLMPQLKAHNDKFQEYFRMEEQTFGYILNKIECRIKKTWCNFHQQKISSEERLMLTLRYLSTGLSFRALAFSFRMGKSTVANIVKETVEAIWDELQSLHMPIPTAESMKQIANEFYNVWNFPHVIGCLDGKHIRVKCPANSGSMFYNYKQHFSLVLQALVSANYKYIVIDMGGYGKQSDGGTFHASYLFNFIENDLIKFPAPDMLPHSQTEAPYVILADEAYPLLPYLMKPYKREGLTVTKRIFNDRLSRARKTVECAFGITTSKWRILSKSIETSVDLADKIVKCICVLHNIVIDMEGINRNLSAVQIKGQDIIWERRGRPATQAEAIRSTFANYFQHYQLNYV